MRRGIGQVAIAFLAVLALSAVSLTAFPQGESPVVAAPQ